MKMKNLAHLTRLLLGALFLTFALNYWFKFLPNPPLEGPAFAFMDALTGSGYLAVVKTLELLGGLLVLGRRGAPLGLLLLGPIIVNICLFNLLLANPFNVLGGLVAGLALFLLWSDRHRWLALVKDSGPSETSRVPSELPVTTVA